MKRLYRSTTDVKLAGVCAGLAEYSWQKLRNQFNTVRDGSAVFSGIMLALFFEADTSLILISGAAFFVIWFGKHNSHRDTTIGKLSISSNVS